MSINFKNGAIRSRDAINPLDSLEFELAMHGVGSEKANEIMAQHEQLAQLEVKKDNEFHAKQQYADMVKAALTGLCAGTDGSVDEKWLAFRANDIAEAALEEMTRRGK